MGKIGAVIFDCDGTLVDSEHAHFSSWRYAVQKQGGDLSPSEYIAYVGHPEEPVRALANKIGTDCGEEILRDKTAHYRQLHTAGHPPIQATLDFLRLLANEKKRLGLKLGLASAAARQEILMNLRHHQIEHVFDVILSGQDDLDDYSDPEGVNKPKPYIYLHAAKQLNLAPDQCIVIEDSRTGVTAGVDAGCFTIAVPNSYTQHQDLSHAHWIVDSFSDISVNNFLQMISKLRK
jgi:beta-phosphoglucomutase-like phosphatase (HAD superfamily)